MKKLLLCTAIFFISQITYGQIETKTFPQKNAFEKIGILKKNSKAEKIKKMPSFNIESMLEEDKMNEGKDVPFRFGKGFDVNISLSDGTWIEVDGGRLWSLEFESSGAYSINFIFNNFYLPEGATLYIGNNEGSMLYGPVTSHENTKNGYFLTDLIAGNRVTIYLFEPKDKLDLSKLTIKRVIHGYKNLFLSDSNGNFGGSWACNNDVVCFPEWSTESDAVALVLLSNGDEWCSGSLLMSANQVFRPYFLSAFHCIDTDQNGELAQQEISNSQNWLFKFQYKRTSCGGNSATTGMTFNSATFRSAWNASDFALMEMNTSPLGDSRFAWLGWDRSGNNPIEGTGIHHPAGDVMKISFDNDNITPNAQTFDWGNNNISPINSHWIVGYDNGTTQGGSSGSPLFNEDKRVVGQLHGGFSGCAPIIKRYGRFNISWTGGGTNATRLSNWLDPTNTGIVNTNTAHSPSISGPTQICNQGTYTINYLPPGANVTWNSSPTGYLQLVSGQGTGTAIFSKILNKNNIIISAVISINGASFTIFKSGIQTGTPYSAFEIYDAATDFQVTRVFVNKDYYFYGVENAIEDDEYQWTITSPSPYPVTTAIDGRQAYYTTSKVGQHLVTLQYNGACGWSDIYSEYVYFESTKKTLLTLSPNPATELVTLAVTENGATDSSILSLNNSNQKTIETDYQGTYEIQLWNENSGLVKTIKGEQSKLQISLRGLPKGMYYVHLIIEGKTIQKKILWLK